MKWWNDILPYQGALAKDDKQLCRAARVVEGGPDPEKTDEVFLIRHRVSRIYYKGKFFDYPVSFSAKTFKNMGFCTSFVAGCSYISSCAHKLPEDSLENFYINRFGKKLYSMFFEGYTTKVWGRIPAEISADWGAQRVKGVSIAALLKNVLQKGISRKNNQVETSLIEEFYYPKYGPGQLWETVAKKFAERGGKLFVDKEVNGFEREGQKIRGVKCEDGSTYACDAVFSSMPLNQLVPALGGADSTIENIASGLPYRDFVTVGLLVDKLNLKNETNIPTFGNIVPDCWIYNKSEEDTVKLAVEELKKIGVIDSSTKIKDFCRARIKKAYPAYFDTYGQINTLIEYLNGFENLYCIGRNGQHRYNNMDHSMVTAFIAIDCLEGKTSKDDIWNVNTENKYNEEK